MQLSFLLPLAAIATSASAVAADVRPIEIGTSHAIQSKALGQRRVVNVVLPAGYAKDPGRRYPVLYLIDGGLEQDLLHVAGVVHLGALWGRSAEAIVVGIETQDRRRELVGPTRDPELLARYPTAGSSASFRAFIRDEVKPLVDRTYRTSGRSIVLGESLAGLFVAETYLAEPGLFDAYGAIDPSLWWDKEALSLGAATRLGDRQKGRPLFVAMAREQLDTPAAGQRLVAALREKALPVCAAARPDLTHATIYQQIAPQAVQHLLPPAEAPPPEYGFEVQCADRIGDTPAKNS